MVDKGARTYRTHLPLPLICGLLITLILSLLLLNCSPVLAVDDAEPDFSWQETMSNLDLEMLESYKQNIDGEVNNYLEHKPIKEWFIDFVKGDWQFDLQEVVQNIISYFFKEVIANSGLLGKILILSVLAALLINLQTAFASSVARVSYLACFLALCAIALGSFKIVLQIGQNTIDTMVGFMIGMLPQMLVLVAGLGNINSSVMLFPILMTTATAFANAIKNIVFPLIIMSAILHMVNHMSETIKVERLASFFAKTAQVSLGFFLTVFVGIVSLRALYASVLDKVTLRTTRFITDNAIPVVGKMFSDTIEIAAGYVVMLKQALGIFGVVIVFGIIIFPLLKIAAIALIYKITAAIAEPLGDARTAAILETMSVHLFLMLAAVAAVGLMFFIMIAIIAAMSNSAIMMK
ncbi:MAG TPA: stage III sporulation protein AE [Syntrophomonadaceae bacterium]|nr:stage III sporulation protein AE [Syntrophomonadaceae bacterium]